MLILEGDPLTVRIGMLRRATLGALTWLTTIQDIPLPPGDGPARTAALLVTLARQRQRGGRGPTGVVKPKAPTPREQRTAVLAALPGVGPVLAARLGSLRGVLDADAEALGAMPGIGEELGARASSSLTPTWSERRRAWPAPVTSSSSRPACRIAASATFA